MGAHGTTTLSEKPGSSDRVIDGAADRRGPLAQPGQPVARAGRLRRPARRRGPRPRARRGQHGAAPRAAVPDHVGDALADRPGEQLAQVGRHVVGGVGQVGLDLGGRQRGAGAGQLAGQGELAVALDGPAYVGQRVARQPLEVGELGPGALGSTSSSRLASSALTVITVREWPRMSCRSRAKRLRSFSTASRAFSSRTREHLDVAVDRLRDAPDRQRSRPGCRTGCPGRGASRAPRPWRRTRSGRPRRDDQPRPSRVCRHITAGDRDVDRRRRCPPARCVRHITTPERDQDRDDQRRPGGAASGAPERRAGAPPAHRHEDAQVDAPRTRAWRRCRPRRAAVALGPRPRAAGDSRKNSQMAANADPSDRRTGRVGPRRRVAGAHGASR